MKDLTKNRYGSLVVLELNEIRNYKSKKNTQTKAYWLCQCDCGTKKVIRGEHLTAGKTVSCGCVARELASKRMKRLSTSHGLSNKDFAGSYYAMLARIIRPDEHHKKYYSGISICERWLGEDGMTNFYQDMGDKPSADHQIDRIDNEGDYEASNCRWATRSENMQNTRRQKVS